MRNDKKSGIGTAPRQFAMDKLFNMFLFLGFGCIALGGVSFDKDDIGFFVFMVILGVFLISGGIFTTPCGYFFDKEGVSVRYVFYAEERYL